MIATNWLLTVAIKSDDGWDVANWFVRKERTAAEAFVAAWQEIERKDGPGRGFVLINAFDLGAAEIELASAAKGAQA